MEAGFTILIALFGICFGVVVGVIVGMTMKNNKNRELPCGVLNVDCSDPANGAYLYLELNMPIAEVADHKQVSFNVHVIN